VLPDKFGTSLADRSRELDRFNLCSRVVLQLMGPAIRDHAAVDQLEIKSGMRLKKCKIDAKADSHSTGIPAAMDQSDFVPEGPPGRVAREFVC
jgi:hypothetical protein